MDSVLRRNNVHISGPAQAPAMVFFHGFGCDQEMWGGVAPAFVDDHRVVLYDHTGAGVSDLAAYDPNRYASLTAYAEDLVEIGAALERVRALESIIPLCADDAHRMGGGETARTEV